MSFLESDVSNSSTLWSGTASLKAKADDSDFPDVDVDALARQAEAEKRVLFKLDAVLLTFLSLGYFIKTLDQSNVSSAFVSGMKEDLSMWKNELTTAVTCWVVGYTIGQIPSNLLLVHWSPRYWIPTLEIAWGLLTLVSYRVQTPRQLYAIRFAVGLAESGFFPGANYILGSFYKPSELGKRSVIFHTSSGLGSLCSSLLQTVAFKKLSGRGGLAGWRWLFLLDGFITIPIAVLGYIFLPSLPGQKSFKPSFWLSEVDLHAISSRMGSVGRAPVEPLTRARVRRFASSWRFWALPVMFALWNNSGHASTIMALWLKSSGKYSVPQINLYVMPITGVYMVTAITFSFLSDGVLKSRRWPPMLFTAVLNTVIVLTLAKLPVYEYIKTHWVLFYLTSVSGGMSGLIFSWANELCSADSGERALVIALMNDCAYVVQAIVPNFVWKQTSYPKPTVGLLYTAALSTTFFFWVLLVRHLSNRDKALAARELPAGVEETTALLGTSIQQRVVEVEDDRDAITLYGSV